MCAMANLPTSGSQQNIEWSPRETNKSIVRQEEKVANSRSWQYVVGSWFRFWLLFGHAKRRPIGFKPLASLTPTLSPNDPKDHRTHSTMSCTDTHALACDMVLSMASHDAAQLLQCRGVPQHGIIRFFLMLGLFASTSAFFVPGPGPTGSTVSSISGRTIPLRHAAARNGGEVAAVEAPTAPFVEDVPAWPVPACLRREEPLGGPEPSHVRFLGLAEVFKAQDGIKLADLFDTDSAFRCV